jgi:hypothetical protein
MKVLLKDAVNGEAINSIVTVDGGFHDRITQAIEEHYDMEVISLTVEETSKRPLAFNVNVTFEESQTSDFVLEQVWEY